MIFLSHNYKDKPVVEQVAIKLRSVFGQNKVFYDSWSIQPGDGIIDKMEKGLTDCKFFFFFVSSNSLQSQMVKMEWQNAIFKAAQNAIRLIPVRMDNCEMPFLLTQTLYIDLFTNGIDVALRQIIDVINGNNTFRNSNTNFSNLQASIRKTNNTLEIECTAKFYLEPVCSFAFCTQANLEEIKIEVCSDSYYESSRSINSQYEHGKKTNVIYLKVSRGILPDFPFIVRFSNIRNKPFEIESILHEIKKDYFGSIPIIFIK